ncbi:MAG TPA: hypothetical protein VIY86_00905, partial [Pirellulaceae bacterium]
AGKATSNPRFASDASGASTRGGGSDLSGKADVFPSAPPQGRFVWLFRDPPRPIDCARRCQFAPSCSLRSRHDLVEGELELDGIEPLAARTEDHGWATNSGAQYLKP